IGEIAVRVFCYSAVDVFDFSTPQLVGFKNTLHLKRDVQDAAIQFGLQHNMDTMLLNFEPKPRQYGLYRSETKALEQNFGKESTNMAELLKAWNLNYLRNAHDRDSLHFIRDMFAAYGNGKVYAFRGYDSIEFPCYRYLPNSLYPQYRNRFNSF